MLGTVRTVSITSISSLPPCPQAEESSSRQHRTQVDLCISGTAAHTSHIFTRQSVEALRSPVACLSANAWNAWTAQCVFPELASNPVLAYCIPHSGQPYQALKNGLLSLLFTFPCFHFFMNYLWLYENLIYMCIFVYMQTHIHTSSDTSGCSHCSRWWYCVLLHIACARSATIGPSSWPCDRCRGVAMQALGSRFGCVAGFRGLIRTLKCKVRDSPSFMFSDVAADTIHSGSKAPGRRGSHVRLMSDTFLSKVCQGLESIWASGDSRCCPVNSLRVQAWHQGTWQESACRAAIPENLSTNVKRACHA